MRQFIKQLAVVALVLACFLCDQSLCGGAFDIDDISKDLEVNTDRLPGHITRIFKSRAEDLAQKIKNFEYDETAKNYIIYEHNDIIIHSPHIAEDDKNNNYFIKKLGESLRNSYQFFTDPEFFTITPTRFDLTFGTDIPLNLVVFYVQTASHFSVNYTELIKTRSHLTQILKETETSPQQHIQKKIISSYS